MLWKIIQAYTLLTGCFSIGYYLVLVGYSRRWNTTFAGFWLLLGGVHLIVASSPVPHPLRAAFFMLALLFWILFLFVQWHIWRGMKPSDEEVDWIIVLGAQVRGTQITNSLKRRLDRAVEYLSGHPAARVVVSGGKGPGEWITEAEAMANYLLGQGIERERIRLEDKSSSTAENLRYSACFLEKERDRVGIVTNNFHSYRASLTAKDEGYRRVVSIPADSNPVFQLNYLVREFFAVVKIWLIRGKLHRK